MVFETPLFAYDKPPSLDAASLELAIALAVDGGMPAAAERATDRGHHDNSGDQSGGGGDGGGEGGGEGGGGGVGSGSTPEEAGTTNAHAARGDAGEVAPRALRAHEADGTRGIAASYNGPNRRRNFTVRPRAPAGPNEVEQTEMLRYAERALYLALYLPQVCVIEPCNIRK